MSEQYTEDQIPELDEYEWAQMQEEDSEANNNAEDDSLAIPYFYKTPSDIVHWFRDRVSINKFLEFFLDESHAFADEIDKVGNPIPYPIIYDKFLFQTDYHFFVHCIAKWISLKCNDAGKYKVVIRHFGVLFIKRESTEKSFKTGMVINRNLLMYVFERLNPIFNLGNYLRKSSYLLVFSQKLIKYKDVYIEMKSMGFAKKNPKVNVGPEKYLGKIWTKKTERFITEIPIEQVAFGSECRKFLKENELKKINYFHLHHENFDSINEYKEMLSFD